MKKIEYSQKITDEDRLDVSFTQNKGKISKFSINYSSLINEEWHDILRIDNCHGKSHQHTFHLFRAQFKFSLGEDNNKVFTWAKEYIVKNRDKIKQNYINVKPRKI